MIGDAVLESNRHNIPQPQLHSIYSSSKTAKEHNLEMIRNFKMSAFYESEIVAFPLVESSDT